MKDIQHWYLHVDLDAFFASVEELDHPEYRGKPLIVGGKPEDRRSVVSTASYEARKYGVHSAMPTYQAYRLCPQGIFVYPRMERYSELSYQIMNIFRNFSPDVDQMSIDEAFIDITGTERLFGPPEETARKIKACVKKETGLTVSVGLASTKYLAKIASGFSKPDGFYYIHSGDEEKFMLNLPLDKVWGLGQKSQDLLHSKGFYSTRDIHEKPYDILEFLFGKNMGTFLYDVVRGKENSSFNTKPKNHSISAETTFPYDLTDIYGIETELMELAQGVYFRLLKEKSFSKTAFVKIRYGDFSTSTIQTTLDKNISTLDSYFEIIKDLFEKKYENGRGIRLIGLGFENVTKEETPGQQELFSNNDEKKQKVEKAILNLQKKHPEIKINKARTLKSLAVFLLFSAIFSKSVYAETKENTISQEGAAVSNPDIFYRPSTESENTQAPESLFNWKINDKNNVEFLLSGYWQMEVSDSAGSSFGNGTPFALSLNTPVFKQEIDLSFWLLLNKHWYFEADFADEFKKNTLALGYTGENFVRSVRLSNRSITLENDYSADIFGFGLKGGKNQAPGLSSHFQSDDNKLELDFLLRYDMTSTKSAVFYGMNSVQDNKIALENFLYGYAYHFPEEAKNYLSAIKNIYVENTNGKYTDSNGRRYKKLSTSDYIYHPQTNRLYLSVNANAGKKENQIPLVLVTFTDETYAAQIINSSGNYSNPSTYFGQLQSLFDSNSSGKKYKLADYTGSLTCTIESSNALVIQNSTGFSPYLCADTYDGGLSSDADILIVNASTDTAEQTYIGEETDLSFISLEEDFFYEKHLYAKISSKNQTENLYPFVSASPEIYLNLSNTSNLQVLVRSYSPVSEFQIGTNIAEGSVTVYKNNVIDSGARYNSDTGCVTLSSSPASTDKIYITWQEDTEDFSNGSLTGGTGIKYHITPELTVDSLFSARWPLWNSQEYASPSQLQKGYIALSGGINYRGENFSIADKSALALQKDNASKGLLLSAQADQTSKTYYLEATAGYITKASPYLNTDTPVSLDSSLNQTITNHTGSSDSEISGYKIPLNWDFSPTNQGWAAVDIKLNSGNLLKNSSKLNIALKPDFTDSNPSDAYEVYLQLGVKASQDFYGENSTNIPVWKIQGLNLNSNTWQTISISLDDKDRARLVSDYDARLIVLPSSSYDSSLHSGKGKIWFGPYEPVLKSLNTFEDDKILVTSSSSYISNGNYSSVFSWNIPSTTDVSSLEDTKITAVSYFDSADFSSYEWINLKFAINGEEPVSAPAVLENYPGFTLILDDKASDYQSNGNIALKLEINDITSFFDSNLAYHTLKINNKTKKVYLDDSELSSGSYELYINSKVLPGREKIILNTIQGTSIYKKGSFCLNDLTCSETDFYMTLQNNLTSSYKKDGNILAIKDYSLIKDFHADINASQSLSHFEKPDFNSSTYAESGITLANLILTADTSFENINLTSAGHSVKSEEALFSLISLEENYRFNKTDSSLKKYDKLSIDFSPLKVPYTLSFETKAEEKYSIRTQESLADSKLNLKFSEKSGLNWTGSLKINQKINTSKNNLTKYNYDNYFYGWYDISKLEFSAGEEKASFRNSLLKTKIQGITPFANFKPEIEYSIKGYYNNSSCQLFTDTTKINLSLPFTLKDSSISFNMDRTGGGSSFISEGGSYISDAQTFFNLQKDRSWIYTRIPFYELFEKDLKNNISAEYAGKYELTYKRKLFNDTKDLYIPSNANLAFIRNINNEANYSDLYQIKAVITNTSLNNLGSDSKNKYFTWFKQEELISNITGIIKIPLDLPENTSFLLTAYIQALLMLNNNSKLTCALDGSLETEMNWSGRITLIYSRPGKSSFITEFTKWLIPAARKVDFEISRKDLMNIEISRKDLILKQNYKYQHNMDFSFLKYFTITSGIAGKLNLVENSASNLSIELSLGGKAEF